MLARAPLVAVLLCAALATACHPTARGAVAPTPGPAPTPRLPALPLVTLAGEATTLPSLQAGRPALVSLWASWCEPCLAEFPALQRFVQGAPARDVIGVAVAVGERRAQVAAFVARNGLTYTHLVDEEFRFADALGQRRVPTTLVADREGRITYAGGAFDEEALAAVRALLGPAP